MATSFTIQDKILYGLDISSGKGLEIGPLMNPLVDKNQGNVKYVDRATTGEIKAWYKKNETVDQDKIVDVDYVWGDKTLAQCAGENNKFDYCVAAHVIEHVPDLIGWLKEISDVLKEGGIASFSVPDRRYTFDYLRSESVMADLIDAYYRKLKKPSIRHIYDHFSAFTEIDIVEAWTDGFDGRNLKPLKEPYKVNKICEDAQRNDKYIDSHCWVFTVQSFISILDSLNHIGLLDFRIKRFFDVEYCNFEFVIQLEKLPEGISSAEKRELFLKSLKRTINHKVTVRFISYPAGEAQIYYDAGNGFNEHDSITEQFSLGLQATELTFILPPVDLLKLRFDPVKAPAIFKIYDIQIDLFGDKKIAIPIKSLTPGEHVKTFEPMRKGFWGRTYRKADDPHFIFEVPYTF